MTSNEPTGHLPEQSDAVKPSQSADAIEHTPSEVASRVAEAGFHQFREEWIGPLPSPQDLKAFEDVQSGLAERIVALAERHAEHTAKTQLRELELDGRDQEIQEKANEEASRLGRWAIISYTITTFGFLAGAGYVVYLGNEWPGVVLGALPLSPYIFTLIQEIREWVGNRQATDI